jgi:hypothetical protein
LIRVVPGRDPDPDLRASRPCDTLPDGSWDDRMVEFTVER